METEIQATEKFLQNYRTTGYDSAATSAVEIAQELDIDPSFPPSRSGKKRRLFDYQGEEEQRATPELKFKSNFFYPLVDQAIMSIKERFNLLREVSSAFSFLYTRDKLLLVQQENALLTCCKEFQKKFGDIDSDEMSAELQRFVIILQKKRNLNTAQDFLNYLLKTHLFELYPNVYIALRILLTCPVTVASAERSFSKLKLIKIFNRTSMTDSRLSSLAMLSIENDCARSLDYDNVVTAFANKKVRSRLFKRYCVFITFSCFSVSLLSFRSVCINVLLNSGIGAEFFMTCTFGIGMLYSDISLFTYVQIVVYFLNAAFQFYTSKVI